MYPPKATDPQVQTVIHELAAEGDLPSGAAVRTALLKRYGCRGGVARIYRLLANERARLGTVSTSPIGMGLLEQENRNLLEQLQLVRQREDAHQAHWNREIRQLWERLQALESQVDQAAAAGRVSEALRKEVKSAEIRAGQLDVQIRAFGPAAARIKPGK